MVHGQGHAVLITRFFTPPATTDLSHTTSHNDARKQVSTRAATAARWTHAHICHLSNKDTLFESLRPKACHDPTDGLARLSIILDVSLPLCTARSARSPARHHVDACHAPCMALHRCHGMATRPSKQRSGSVRGGRRHAQRGAVAIGGGARRRHKGGLLDDGLGRGLG